MVQFHPDAHPAFRSLDQMEVELKTIFDRDVDLITREGVETSRNYLRRHAIPSSAQVIYAAGSSISAGLFLAPWSVTLDLQSESGFGLQVHFRTSPLGAGAVD